MLCLIIDKNIIMIENNIQSVSQFIDAVQAMSFAGGIFGNPFWFRAESSKFEKTSLIPSIFREYLIGPSTVLPFYKKESNQSYFFQYEAFPYLNKSNLINNKLGTAFVMQHYGAQTRFLDWTENSLISLFFAVEDISNNFDGYVWVLDAFRLNSYTKRIKNGTDRETPFIYPSINPSADVMNYFDSSLLENESVEVRYPIGIKPFYIDERMKNQGSCFTLFGHEKDGLKQHPDKANFMNKIIIESRHFRKIKKELYKMGVSYDSIYPGLEGISKKTVYAFDEYFI